MADEPTGDLDRVSADDILAMLARLNSEMGKTIIMVTHDPHAAKSAHSIRHLEKGELDVAPRAVSGAWRVLLCFLQRFFHDALWRIAAKMHFLKLISRNTLRHKLRTGLTVLGLVVAILAFGLLRTVVDAWYAGAENASSTRLVTRSSISLVFQLPINYQERIRKIPGVSAISHANWFGGVYITEKNFFPQFAVDGKTYFDLYPEYLISPAEMKAFRTDRKGCVIGRKLANTYGFKVGDTIPLRGTIYPGAWSFTVRAIYDGAEAGTDTSQFFFHWDYLNETMKKAVARRTD